jgi:hypothetical protein
LHAGDSLELLPTPTAHDVNEDAEIEARARLLQTFANYRLGIPLDPEALLQLIPQAKLWSPGQRAVFAALLASSGKKIAAAFQFSERIYSSLLLAEEQRLLLLAR